MDGPYRAVFWPDDLGYTAPIEHRRFHVLGPDIAGGWHATVPQSHSGMTQEHAHRLASLMNLAFAAGKREAQTTMRAALGL